jgi:uncharacterized protein
MEQSTTSGEHLTINTVIVKVTNDCNLECKYCFVERAVPRSQVIAMETLRALFDQLERYVGGSPITVVWHGGEPLLPGVEFYRRVIELQAEYSLSFMNCIQTNGILLSDKVAEFFSRNNFRIGVSIDGPSHLNDQARVFRNGKGSFGNIMQGIRTLQSRNIPFGILSTISRINVRSAQELYFFCKAHGLSLKTSSLYDCGNAVENLNDVHITANEYADFLSDLLKIWVDDSEPIEIDAFQSFLGSMLAKGVWPTPCSSLAECHRKFLCLGPSGDLYPCGLFQGHLEYRYGNIYELPIEDIPKTETWKRMSERRSQIRSACGDCEVMEYCNGGCSFRAFANAGDFLGRDYYCQAYKRTFSELLSFLNSTLRKVQDEERRSSGKPQTTS